MTRGRKTDLTLCRNFCVYYKPGKNEELRCGGYLAVQHLRRRGKLPPIDRRGRPAPADPLIIKELGQRICPTCDFREADCDFTATAGRSAPCGGIVYLSHLGSAEATSPVALMDGLPRRPVSKKRRRS